jgi:hypothetical protein
MKFAYILVVTESYNVVVVVVVVAVVVAAAAAVVQCHFHGSIRNSRINITVCCDIAPYSLAHKYKGFGANYAFIFRVGINVRVKRWIHRQRVIQE